jgi:energy-coupling factor transporter transmembrane protein EcfT
MGLKTISMPKTITTLEKYNEWVKSFETPTQELEVSMKTRSYYPYSMSVVHTHPEKGDKVDYLISDSVSTGYAYVKNFNRCFSFKIRTYE